MERPVQELVGQQVFGLAPGYKDLNDHDLLRSAPLLAVLIAKTAPHGENRRRAEDSG